MGRYTYLTFALLLVGAPLSAQNRTVPQTGQVEEQDENDLPVPEQPLVVAKPYQLGRVAETSAGEVGQRQTRGQSASGVDPTARIAGRLQTRVQNRLRNRIDRNYKPQ